MKNLILSFHFTIIIFSQIIAQQNNSEFRANWVITWEYISSSSSTEQNKARIRQILDEHKAGNFTSVLWQVRQSGTAYYNSSFEPYGSYAGGSYPGFDPLAYAIDEAHKRGLELHAWFNVFSASSTAQGTPAQEHPEWICRDQSGNPMTSSIALSPGLQAVRDYTKNVAMEIVNNYDIDGLHLDYCRWNEFTSSTKSKEFEKLQAEHKLLDGEITEDQIEELTENSAGRYLYDVDHPYSAGIPSGFSSWEQWWRWSVTEFVRTLHDSIQAVKPYVRLSVAALGKYNWSGWNGYYSVFQDAALWFNQGYIEQISAMHYHWTTGSGFYGMLAGACPECWSQFIQPGIAAKRFYTVGPPSYILSDNNIWNNHIEIVNTCRSVNWVDGFQFFSYADWKDHAYWDDAASSFFNKKVKIRDANLHLDTIPASPTISIQKLDSLHYRLTVTPDASTNQNQWFAVYRSADDNFNLNSDEIISVSFGNTQFVVDDSFTGNQDFNGEYRYTATMLDRYWNESLISNIVKTDSLPSFAPKIISSVPREGDTVAVTTQIKLDFSKTLNTSTITASTIHINPPIEISNVVFSNSGKTVTITTASNFAFQTNYSVILDSTLTDVNGKMLDGNGDGLAGDSYVLYFSTVAQDLSGPIVTQVFPDSTNSSGSFDVEAVVTIIFDELINSATINHNNVVLKAGTTAISKDMQVRTVGNQSLLSIKTSSALLNNTQYSLTLKQSITDAIGNMMPADKEIFFTTSDLGYAVKTTIDDFSTEANWEQPEYSGSTVGIVDSGTSSGYSTFYFLPTTFPAKSFFIQYQWNPSATTKLLREYLSGGTPRSITFDTSYILQAYVWGDGSRNKFRFAIDEGDGTAWPNHEVSKWIAIDWYGWRLIEWNLKDPASVGSWIGNGVLDYPKYRIDSFQMTDAAGSQTNGTIYIDNFRLVKKSIITGIENEATNTPNDLVLYQNYPNPFNPSTKINFTIPSADNPLLGGARVGLVTLKVYDVLGNEVATLVNEYKPAGTYEVEFTVGQTISLSSGVYYYQLKAGEFIQTKKMILVK
ncbi:MAG: family 10 glycosylhydrolase [Ignavibacteriaceae bacterium]|nr:family 10 glycosylhydrolase [Ignavibacteriaceae bacterium]